jgi:hypothetical protein
MKYPQQMASTSLKDDEIETEKGRNNYLVRRGDETSEFYYGFQFYFIFVFIFAFNFSCLQILLKYYKSVSSKARTGSMNILLITLDVCVYIFCLFIDVIL